MRQSPAIANPGDNVASVWPFVATIQDVLANACALKLPMRRFAALANKTNNKSTDRSALAKALVILARPVLMTARSATGQNHIVNTHAVLENVCALRTSSATSPPFPRRQTISHPNDPSSQMPTSVGEALRKNPCA